jgi:negative regulator of sigma-B (phosphoserine phosphatase)
MTLTSPLTWASQSRPLPTETESGDRCVVMPCPGGALLSVIDGLGHGPEAATAAQVAADTMLAHADTDPTDVITQCHVALRGTRGAAMLVVSLSFRDSTFAWAGVGNVEGWHLRGSRREALVSKAGVVGYQISPPLRRRADLRAGDLFLLASDGISPRFTDELGSGGDPEAMAASILAKHGRATDDALILVVRYEGEPTP